MTPHPNPITTLDAVRAIVTEVAVELDGIEPAELAEHEVTAALAGYAAILRTVRTMVERAIEETPLVVEAHATDTRSAFLVAAEVADDERMPQAAARQRATAADVDEVVRIARATRRPAALVVYRPTLDGQG